MGEDNTGGTCDWLQIRNMTPDDIGQVLDMWKEQGWNRDRDILSIFYQVDPGGFFVAVDTRTGMLVGTCCCVMQHPSLFSIGLYFVRRKLRGLGLGLRLWTAMSQRLGDSNASLNCFAKDLGLYRYRAGYPLVQPWAMLVYVSSALTPEKLPEPSNELRVVPVDRTLLPQVIAYDTLVHCYDRTETVTLTVSDPHGLTRAVLQSKSGQDVVCGFGRIGRCTLGGAIVGPIYAEHPDFAGVLLRALVEGYPLARDRVCMKVLSCNPGGSRLAQTLGFVDCTELLRCYRKQKVHVRFEEIYAVHDNSFCTF